jgi:DNA repair exonuclease SbcCD ATPase subunit
MGQPVEGQENLFTAEQLQAARQQEKDKLYPQLKTLEEIKKQNEAVQAQNEAMQAELKALTEEREARAAQEAAARAKAEEAVRKQQEDKLSAEELVNKRAAEFDQKLEQERKSWEQKFAQVDQERAMERAIAEKERQFNEIRSYIQSRVSELQQSNDVMPELFPLITGNTVEEVDASIARMKERTDAIVASLASELQQQRAQMPGVSTAGYTTVGPDAGSGQQSYSNQDIVNMPMKEWADLREKMGLSGSGQGKGIFG